MKCRSSILIFCYAIKIVASECHKENFKVGCNTNQVNNLSAQNFESEEFHQTTVIFDISSNVTSKEIFDVSIKYFLKSISKYCNTFKYVIIGDKFDEECESENGCKVIFNVCEISGCSDTIDNMEYSNMIASYSNEIYEEDSQISKDYLKFLNKTFIEIDKSFNNSVFLLTNRIISLEENAAIIQAIEDSSIKLTTILLGSDNENSTQLLENAYQNIPNSRIFNFVNFDCLSYLLYCLLPCSIDTPECMSHDIYGCRYFSKWTPNYYPNRTLHVWYVLAFNLPFSNMSYFTTLDSLQKGFKDYIIANDIVRYQYKVVTNNNVITRAYEDINDFYNLFIYNTGVNGDVVDDESEMNERLSLVPWSGTLIETRIGLNFIIILTNYATTDLKTIVNGQNLQGQMYVYNVNSFQYYSGVIQNNSNFVFYKSFYTDYIYINVNDSIKTTTTSTTAITTTSSASTLFVSSSSHLTIPQQQTTTILNTDNNKTTTEISTSKKPGTSSTNCIYFYSTNMIYLLTFFAILN